MATKLVRYRDGVLVEVDAQPDSREEVSDSGAEKLERTFDAVRDSVNRLILPIATSLASLKAQAPAEVDIQGIDLELNLGFEVGGNIYIAKLGSSGSIKAKISIKGKQP